MNDNSESKREKVIKYLEKTLSELTDEQSQLSLKMTIKEAKIKETYNAINIAEKEIDPNYNLFSPKKTGKIKMNDTLTKEVHALENEYEDIKYKNKRLLDKIETTKDIISCIVKDEEEVFIDNSEFLDSLIAKQNGEDDNDNNLPDIKNDIIDNNSNDNSDDEFEMVDSEIEKSDEYIFDDELRKKFLNIQESEKNRIARELHDTTVQNLTSLVHKTELCMKLVDMDTVRTKLEMQTMINTLKDSINELRQIIYGLKPMSLDDFGLSVTVRKFIEQLNLEIKPKFFLEIEGFEPKDIDPVVSLTLFRIIQEACNNVIKHAQAERVDILIDYMDDLINVIVIDDGKGFDHDEDVKKKNPLSGFGLSIMKERIYLLSGTLKIDYNDENNKTGTKIIVSIPITKCD